MEGCFLIALRVVQRQVNCSLVADETTPCNSGLVMVLLSIKDMTEEKTAFMSVEVYHTLEKNNPICLQFTNHFPHLFQKNFIFVFSKCPNFY